MTPGILMLISAACVVVSFVIAVLNMACSFKNLDDTNPGNFFFRHMMAILGLGLGVFTGLGGIIWFLVERFG